MTKVNRTVLHDSVPTLNSFKTGGVVRTSTDMFKNSEGLFEWQGVVPHEVPADSTPESAGGIGVGAWVLVASSSAGLSVYNSVQEAVLDLNLKEGSPVVCANYYEGGTSGTLFFKVVARGTGTEDGGKFINLQNGLQLQQNIKYPCDPRAWGAVGSGSISNATKDTSGVQNAINYGSVYITDGTYYINKTIAVRSSAGIDSSPNAVLHFINESGECLYINNGNSEISNTTFRVRLIDGGKGRANSWSVVCNKVARSVLAFEVIPDVTMYQSVYKDLPKDTQLDLKYGLRVYNNSYTNSIESHLYQSTLLLESPDNNIVEPCVIWSNNRRYSVILRAASNLFQGVQLISGEEAGVYSDSNDITNLQIIGCYFDGNTRLQSVIPTGDCIKLTGNLRRSTILGNRFFIPAKASIIVQGQLQSSSINSNFFSNGDSADTGAGDIVLGSSTGSVITGNTFFRSNFAEKTGAARQQPPQPPIKIGTAGEYDEPTYVSLNSLQGNNTYRNSEYPSVSAVITSQNHVRLDNTNSVYSRYDDKRNIKCYSATLSKAQIDALGTGKVYCTDINVLGLTNGAGYIETDVVQDYSTGASTGFAKQVVYSQADGKISVRFKDSGTWGVFRTL